MEVLSFDNILGADEIENLFSEDNEVNDTTNETEDISIEESNEESLEEDIIEKEEATEVNVDNLFTEPESVGSEKEDNIEGQEGTTSEEDLGTSPKNNFYSSIAKALKEEGIFPDLEDSEAEKIKAPEDLSKIIESQIKSQLDARQKRIDDALEIGVEPNIIKQYENTLSYLEHLENGALDDESQEGENIRKQLIYQDLINRGFSKERAEKSVKRSLDLGTDIEDAKEALASNKEFFSKEYNSLIEESKQKEEKFIKERQQQANKLKKSILEDDKVFGDIQVNKATRQKVYDTISKPVYKDPNTGQILTALQKYEMENRTDFLKNVGLLFTLTDGFKNLDGLVKGKVNKEVKKGLRELEHTLNNTARTSDGNLKFVSGVQDDPESFISKGWDLDI